MSEPEPVNKATEKDSTGPLIRYNLDLVLGRKMTFFPEIVKIMSEEAFLPPKQTESAVVKRLFKAAERLNGLYTLVRLKAGSGAWTETEAALEIDETAAGELLALEEPKVRKKLLEFLQKGAEAGLGPAQYLLGSLHIDGSLGPKEIELGLAWLEAAAGQGHPEAQYELAVCYAGLPGFLAPDLPLAVEWMQKAADQGHAHALYTLGQLYTAGIIMEQDYEFGFSCLQKAADENLPEAQRLLGDYYDRGLGLKKDPDKAFQWYSLAAMAGLPEAFHNLALCYLAGTGVKQDLKMYHDFLFRAAEKGLAGSQYLLALSYLHGQGTDMDLSLGLYWLRLAAENNLPTAQYALGFCYIMGKYLPRDPMAGTKWMQKAFDRGSMFEALYTGDQKQTENPLFFRL
ncbi:MAG: sel1 repeat family protein [Deltaproteobacteria bacterium]|jgi:TPR repeat protein|nr:sel1 repeat family protein [Deltaproteobacteria bacterium]